VARESWYLPLPGSGEAALALLRWVSGHLVRMVVQKWQGPADSY